MQFIALNKGRRTRMDRNGKALEVSNVVVFNENAHFHRCHYIFARITNISPKGALTVEVLPTVITVTGNTPEYHSCIVKPNLDVVVKGKFSQKLQPKRGKQADAGYYRWTCGSGPCDVYIELMDSSEVYTESNCS